MNHISATQSNSKSQLILCDKNFNLFLEQIQIFRFIRTNNLKTSTKYVEGSTKNKRKVTNMLGEKIGENEGLSYAKYPFRKTIL